MHNEPEIMWSWH